ncbi:DUF6308 family protein [Myceligenerans indicum]|uniref:HhH-GPD domain-containing protein n=1 Tax=Myceligenerans indicum TaxID=2593663 RepID=A0ABS1LRJ1_9MICO|nr:DUF6308 family protein [Myceligenerans indicum]MBL0888788.1 hypothetical protein [Myceligenerans indicum]
MDEDHTRRTRKAVESIIAERGAELVAAYYSKPWFTGRLFDDLGDNDPVSFTPDDVVAASLLDVRFGPQAVRALLIDQRASELLAAIPPNVALWAVGEKEYDAVLGRGSAAWRLWDHLMGIPGIGGTRASKVLARKRPALMPILDSVVRERVRLGKVDAWASFHALLQDSELRARIDALAHGDLPPEVRPSTLRLLDVATWMRYSQSRNALKVRKHLGLPD